MSSENGNRCHRLRAGIIAGITAGIVMSAAMMSYMIFIGRSLWTMPNLIAAMWYGEGVAGEHFCTATIAGFLTHVATSILMGLVAIPFLRDLSRKRTVLSGLSYALASYPVVFALVLSWANPLMVERAELLPMTAGHAIFGLVLGLVYHSLQERQGSAASVNRQ